MIALLLLATLGTAQTGDLNKGLVFDAPLTTAHLQSATVASNRTPYGLQCDPINSPTYGSDGVTFDATTDEIDCGSDSAANITENDEFTASIWVDVEATATFPFIFSKSALGTQGWDFFHNSDETAQVRIRDGSGNTLTVSSVSTIDGGGWHHIVLTYDGANTLEGWLDGVSFGTDSSPTLSGLDNSGGSFTLNQNGNITAGSKVAFAQYWDRKLSDAEVADLYAQGRKVVAMQTGEVNKGLVLDTPLTSGYLQSATVVSDKTPYRNHLTSVGGGTIDGDGFTGDNGGTKYLQRDVADFRSGDNTGSLSLWIKTTESSDPVYGFSSADAASNNDYFIFYLSDTTSYNTSLDVRDTAGGNQIIRGTTTGLNDGAWHHIVYTSNGSRTLLYVDGSPDSTTAPEAADTGKWLADVTNRDNITVGRLARLTPITFTNGTVADVELWAREISATEVGYLYAQGRADIAVETGVLMSQLRHDIPLRTGYAQSATVPSDRSPFEFHMDTILGDPVLGADGATFDGNDCYRVDEPNSDLTALFTASKSSISIWAKSTTLQTGFIYAANDLTSKNGIEIYGVTSGAVRIAFFRGGQGLHTWESSTTPLADNDWHHIVYVGGAGGPDLYVDSILTSVTSVSSSGSSGSRAMSQIPLMDHFTVGCRIYNSGGYGSYFIGEISDLLHYDAELTATEVGYLYDRGRRP